MGVSPPQGPPTLDSRGYIPAFGLTFPSPVGLAAGYDRSGEQLADLERQDFGFVELGTVTPEPLAGHNPGVDALARALSCHHATRRRGFSEQRIGVNLGRQPQHPLSDAGHDFAIGMRSVWRSADYLAINLTGPAGRALLAADRAHELRAALECVREQQEQLSAAAARRVPVLVKCPVRPGAWLDYVGALGFDGVIAVFEDQHCDSPVLPAPQEVARLAHALAPSTALVVGSGIRSASDARRCLAAGARLVQVYRAYVEQGGALIRRINREPVAACSSLS
jgi:dihydroorotate dehydrogenase